MLSQKEASVRKKRNRKRNEIAKASRKANRRKWGMNEFNCKEGEHWGKQEFVYLNLRTTGKF